MLTPAVPSLLLSSTVNVILAVMSIETFERLVGKFELHKLLAEGTSAMGKGDVKPFSKAIEDVKKGLKNGEV